MQAVCADVHIIKAIPNRRFYQSNNLFIIIDTVQVEVIKALTETFKQTTPASSCIFFIIIPIKLPCSFIHQQITLRPQHGIVLRIKFV